MSALLNLATRFRTDLPNYNLEDLTPYHQAQLIGAAVIDEPERLGQFIEDVTASYRQQIGEELQKGSMGSAMLIITMQVMQSPYFRDLLKGAQMEADAAIYEQKRDRFAPDDFKSDLVARHGDAVSFK